MRIPRWKEQGLMDIIFWGCFQWLRGRMRSHNAAETPSSYFRLELEEAPSCVPVLYALADTLVLSHRGHSEVKWDREGLLFSSLFMFLSVCLSLSLFFSLLALVCAFPFEDLISPIYKYIWWEMANGKSSSLSRCGVR